MNPTATLFLKWVAEKFAPNIGDRDIALKHAKRYCSEKWKKYGETIIKRAMKQNTCTSIRNFEVLCDQIKEMLESK